MYSQHNPSRLSHQRAGLTYVGYSLVLLFVLMMLPASLARAAQALAYGQPASGTLNAGQKIEYSFQGKTGDRPVIVMNAHGGDMAPYLSLINPQGQLIGEDSNSGGKGNALLQGIVLAADGIYTVEARNAVQTGSGKYSLIINEEKHRAFFDGPPAAAGAKQDFQLTQPFNHTNVTYHLINTQPGFNPQDVKATIAQALNAWAQVTPLTFTEVSGRGDINIQFAPIDGPYNILGETCPQSSTGCAGDVKFDSAEPWTLSAPNGVQNISLLGVATHEFGHAIGLLHTNDANALMYPEYSPYVLQPAADDVSGAQRLYGNGSGRVTNPTPRPNAPTPNSSANRDQVTGQISDKQYAQFWDFDVKAGDVVTITMRTASGDLDPFLVLLDGQNHVLAYDDDSGGGKKSQDAQLRNIRFPQAGTFTVAATRYGQAQGYGQGDYTLNIQYGAVSAPNPTSAPANNTPLKPGNGGVQASAPQSGQVSQLTGLDSVLSQPFADLSAPGTQARTGTVSSSESYLWSITWCASDAKTLTQNLQNITFAFAINDKAVAANVIQNDQVQANGLMCARAYIVLSGWSPGTVTLKSILTIKAPTFDGQAIYNNGDYVYQYNITAQSHQ